MIKSALHIKREWENPLKPAEYEVLGNRYPKFPSFCMKQGITVSNRNLQFDSPVEFEGVSFLFPLNRNLLADQLVRFRDMEDC